MSLHRRHFLQVLAGSTGAFACLLPSGVMAQQLDATITAPDAMSAVEAGKVVLVDIRSRGEWVETGLAQPALPISMHEPGFLQHLLTALGNDRSRPVALICATGGRTRYLQNELRKLGFTNVTDVSEGMMGSPAGPGWLRRGMAVKPFKP